MTSHPEYAERLDISQFSYDDYGHRANCPMLTAYDNDGCDCAAVLLTEVRRLLAINSSLVQSHNDLLIRQARWAVTGIA